MKLEHLVSEIAYNSYSMLINNSFIESCVKTCNKLRITDDGWCLLAIWERSYVYDIIEILRQANKPMHYKQITAQVNKLINLGKIISTHAVHNTLLRLKNLFAREGLGIYRLAKWVPELHNNHF